MRRSQRDGRYRAIKWVNTRYARLYHNRLFVARAQLGVDIVACHARNQAIRSFGSTRVENSANAMLALAECALDAMSAIRRFNEACKQLKIDTEK